MRRSWFQWAAAIALGVLAWNLVTQVRLQRRILAHGEELQRTVARARSLSQEMTDQLQAVASMEQVIRSMDHQLQSVTTVNGRFLTQLIALDVAVAQIAEVVAQSGGTTADARRHLAEIGQQMERLQQTLRETMSVTGLLSSDLAEVLRLQSGINGQLRELQVKTALLGSESDGSQDW